MSVPQPRVTVQPHRPFQRQPPLKPTRLNVEREAGKARTWQLRRRVLDKLFQFWIYDSPAVGVRYRELLVNVTGEGADNAGGGWAALALTDGPLREVRVHNRVDSDSTVEVRFGEQPAAADMGVEVAAGASEKWPVAVRKVYFKVASGSARVVVEELMF